MMVGVVSVVTGGIGVVVVAVLAQQRKQRVSAQMGPESSRNSS